MWSCVWVRVTKYISGVFKKQDYSFHLEHFPALNRLCDWITDSLLLAIIPVFDHNIERECGLESVAYFKVSLVMKSSVGENG